MAKTKKDALAKARAELCPPPPADPPATRHRSKKPRTTAAPAEPPSSAAPSTAAPPSAPSAPAVPSADVKVKVEPKPKPDEPADPKAPPFEISWENIGLLMNHYNLSEQDASKLLLELVGPDAKGKSFWARYAEKIKADAVKMYADMETDPDYWKKRREALDASTKKSMFDHPQTAPSSDVPKVNVVPEASANPKAAAVPDESKNPGDDEEMNDYDEVFGEDGEEEELDGDPLDEGEELTCGAKGGGDDQDSPSSGACAGQQPKRSWFVNISLENMLSQSGSPWTRMTRRLSWPLHRPCIQGHWRRQLWRQSRPLPGTPGGLSLQHLIQPRMSTGL